MLRVNIGVAALTQQTTMIHKGVCMSPFDLKVTNNEHSERTSGVHVGAELSKTIVHNVQVRFLRLVVAY
jgi:hypothetical protein